MSYQIKMSHQLIISEKGSAKCALSNETGALSQICENYG